MQRNGEGRRAIAVSTLCILSYLVSYLLRNLLAVFNPQMVAGGAFTEGMTAALSSVYMISYAVGQLVCGAAGDYVHPRYMITSGLTAAGGAMIAFALAPVGVLSYILYGLLGLSLSMLRGPIVRLITESCRLSHARIANMFLTFAGFVGPLLAGLLILFLTYRETYFAVGCMAVAMAVLFFFGERLLERRGYIRLSAPTVGERVTASLRPMIREDKLLVYLVLAAVVEITTSSVNHWLTLYMTEALGLSVGAAAMVYSALSVVRALATFVSLPLFYLLGSREDRVLCLSFAVAAVLFFVMCLSEVAWVSILCLFPAEIACSIASAAVWSVYLPSMSARGHVSGVNGLMDATGYFVAALSSLAFVPVAACFSYDGLLLVWCAVCAFAALTALFAKRVPAAQAAPPPLQESEK